MPKQYNTFSELVKHIHKSEPQPNPDYYHILLRHAKLIILEVGKTKQFTVAEKLGMNINTFSLMMKILKEFAND